MRWVHISRLQRWMDGWREWWDGFIFACNTPCALELLYRRWDGEAVGMSSFEVPNGGGRRFIA
uniref:Uncharacterized protein n=1 Tax=Oryza glumipatula TaxID=40148 RepID=A0A0D9YZ24_9ORYZ